MPGKSRNLIIAIGVIVLLGVVFLAGRGSGSEEGRKEERLDGAIAASRIIEATVEEQNKFIALKMNGCLRATSSDPGAIGILKSNQRMVAPFTATYTVDLAGVDKSKMRWNEDSQTLFVELPAATVEPVNIDESRMQVSRDGIWVTERASAELARQGSQVAATLAQRKASEPQYIAKAEDSARVRIGRLLAAPLQTAGLKNVRVVVRFPADGRRSDEQWDMSRSISGLLEQRGEAAR